MLSTAGEHSCSLINSSSAALNSATDQEKPLDHQVEAPPKFSIRSYAFASRSTDIKNTWPFHSQSLQHCLKRGIREPLPPFEPPDLIKARLASKLELNTPYFRCAPVEDVHDKDPVLSNGNTKSTHSNCLVNEQPVLAIENDDDGTPTVSLSSPGTEASAEKEVLSSATDVPDYLDLLIVPSQKKCRLLIKLNSSTDHNWCPEELVSNSSQGSDPMVSKTTCPVCKVFSSTSNTTLNAHMDQCLALEGGAKPAEEQIFKPKVKPRKKKLMVDIYKVAQRCTLEDLDRRNGTNWAELASGTNVRKESPFTENCSPDVPSSKKKISEREGAVYVDSNGIKIRILSKFSDAPPLYQLERKPGPKKFTKDKAMKNMLFSNKTSLKLIKHDKKIKQKLHGEKQKNDVYSKHQSPGTAREDASEGIQKLNPSKFDIRREADGLSIRSSNISKKGRKRGNFNSSRNLSLAARSSAESDSDGSLIVGRHVRAFSRSAQDFPSSSKSNIGCDVENKNASKSGGTLPKWSSGAASTGGMLHKKKKKKGVIGKAIGSTIYKSTAAGTVTTPSTSKRDTFAEDRNNDLSQKMITALSFRKHRSLLRKAHHPNDNEVAKNEERTKKRLRSGTLRITKNCRMIEVQDTRTSMSSDHMSQPGDAENGDAKQERVACANPAKDEHLKKRPRLGTSKIKDCRMLSMQDTRADDSSDNVSVSDNAENGEGEQDTAACANLEISQADIGTTMQVDNSSPSVPSTSLARVTEDAPGDAQAHLAPIGNANDRLRGNEGTTLEGPQDSSSITSNEDSNSDALAAHKRSLAAPQAPSTRFPTTLPSTKAPERNGDLAIKNSIRVEEGGHTLHMNLESEASQCFCSCRTSAAAPVPLSEGKQIQPLYIGPRESSSFSSYRGSRANMKANAELESPGRSFSPMVVSPCSANLPFSGDESRLNPILQAQLPSSPSNPILRLMGKNLTVTSNSEYEHSPTRNSDYMMRGKFIDHPIGFVHGNYALRSESSQYQHLPDPAYLNQLRPPLRSNYMPPASPIQVGGFPHAPPSQHGLMLHPDQHYHHQHKTFGNILPLVHPSYMMKEVITIEDSPEHNVDMPRVSVVLPAAAPPAGFSVPAPPSAARPFFCLPIPDQAYHRQIPVVSAPLYTHLGPLVGVGSTSQGNTSDASVSLISSPFFVPPQAAYMSPSVYYPHNFQR